MKFKDIVIVGVVCRIRYSVDDMPDFTVAVSLADLGLTLDASQRLMNRLGDALTSIDKGLEKVGIERE